MKKKKKIIENLKKGISMNSKHHKPEEEDVHKDVHSGPKVNIKKDKEIRLTIFINERSGLNTYPEEPNNVGHKGILKREIADKG